MKEGKAEDVLEGLSTKVEFLFSHCHDPMARERTGVPVRSERKRQLIRVGSNRTQPNRQRDYGLSGNCAELPVQAKPRKRCRGDRYGRENARETMPRKARCMLNM
ncbi:hypothetical protein GGD41_000484 [Paraburkholderia bryophila]|uniref:Uncharacterized protein n=1 Tax=Paraburkholderia bryophila TaxID=420952 RepID=A0A7Y9W2V3_9BURK|nr:hypothetical protein [Paraburkholderia bryophila]